MNTEAGSDHMGVSAPRLCPKLLCPHNQGKANLLAAAAVAAGSAGAAGAAAAAAAAPAASSVWLLEPGSHTVSSC